MKIALPLDEDKISVCAVFGRAPFFLFYNTDTKEKEIRNNPATEAQGGAGIQAAQFLVDCGADVLLTPRCGENSAEVFKEAGIQIYKSEGTGAEDNLTAFQENKLSRLQKFHSGYHGIR